MLGLVMALLLYTISATNQILAVQPPEEVIYIVEETMENFA